MKKPSPHKMMNDLARGMHKAVQPSDQNPDPDHDGDDDRTPEGDTDHDYAPKPKKSVKSKK